MPVDIVVAKTSDLADGEMKEVSVGEGRKVLLSRVDGQFYATSRVCTHYKAPLVKGVLASDGRLMCPWHGACFRVNQGGDIEDGPALDALQSFPVRVDGDSIIVHVEAPEAFAQHKRTWSSAPAALSERTCVVVGGGAGGLVAAEALRLHGWDGAIRILSADRDPPVDRPMLSKRLGASAERFALRSAEHLDTLRIQLELGVQVVSLDAAGHTLTTHTGAIISYDKLVLATGGTPRTLALPGAQLDNILVLRTAQDAQALAQAVAAYEHPRVAIIGSGFIGMELASALSEACDVTVIASGRVPFERVLGARIGAAIQALHEANDVSFHLQAKPQRFEPKGVLGSTHRLLRAILLEEHAQHVGSVVLSDGTRVDADVVLLAVGVTLCTDFLHTSSIPLERDGSIKVDAHMQVLGVDDIYAVGDIARYPSVYTDDDVRIEHWDVAQNQARVAAMNIAGQLTPFKHVPYFWTGGHGKNLRYCGHGAGHDDVVIQGDVEAYSFVAFYTQGEKVVAVASMGRDPVVSHCSELMRLGKMPYKADVAAGLDVLSLAL